MNNDVFEKYPIPKAVATLALPTILSMIVNILYNMADTFFVGQTNDSNQVAAVSLTMPLFMLFMAVGNMFGIGGSSLISRFLGEKKGNLVKNVSSFCFYGCVVCGIIFSALVFVNVDGISRLIGADENTFIFTKEYLQIISLGGVFTIASGAFSNIVRGEGAAKVSMTGMMIGTIVNIVLDPIMILCMGMGVKGAALATVIGNMSSVVFYLLYFVKFKHKTALSVSPRYFTLRQGIPLAVVSVGLPASINNILMSSANIIMNIFLAGYGAAPVAAMGVALKANMFVVFLQLGLGMGIQPLVGYCYGAMNFKKLKNVIKFSILCNFIMGVVLTVIYVFSASTIIRIFIPHDEEVVAYGVKMLNALMCTGPFIGIMFVFNFSFQAMGKAIPSLILSLSRQGFVFIPCIIIGNYLWGVNGIMFAQPLSDFFSLVLAFIMFIVINKSFKKYEMKQQA